MLVIVLIAVGESNVLSPFLNLRLELKKLGITVVIMVKWGKICESSDNSVVNLMRHKRIHRRGFILW